MKRYAFTLEETQEIKAAGKRIEMQNVEKDWRHLRCEQKGSRTKKLVKPAFTQYITVLVS